eukprot:scaffold15880_cov113-Skeletonema_dohrnii-CCMP3373.AAC.9
MKDTLEDAWSLLSNMMASNDELDDIVREVIEENPPEEQGIRPEWQNHVGWHRKENIFNLRGREDKDADATPKELPRNHEVNTESNEALPALQEVHTLNTTTTFLSSASLVTVLIIFIVCVCKYYCKTNISCSIKPRKTEAELV